MTTEIGWPDKAAFKPLAKGPPPKKKRAPATVACSVSEKGLVTLSFAPELLTDLEWDAGGEFAVHVDVAEHPEALFLKLTPGGKDDRRIRPPMKPRKDGAAPRGFLALGRCGGVELSSRRSAALEHRALTNVVGGALFIAIPKVVDDEGEAGAEEEQGDGEGSGELSDGAEFEQVCSIALAAACGAWPQDIAEGEEPPRPVRVSAAVALIEFGLTASAVRQHFGLEDIMLPEREDMPVNTGRCALAALQALQALD